MSSRLKIGQTLPADTGLVGPKPVNVHDDIIRFYEPNKQENQAFTLKNEEDGTHEVCGILRVDYDNGVFEVLRGGLEIEEVDQTLIFLTPRRLDLTDDEYALFQNSYPYVRRF